MKYIIQANFCEIYGICQEIVKITSEPKTHLLLSVS